MANNISMRRRPGKTTTAKKTPKKAAKKTGTAVAVHKAAPPAPAPQTFLEFLHRASTDPTVDVAKMQAILDMKDRQEARASEAEFDHQMALVQEKMQPIRADMESTKPKNKYASAVKLDAAIRPIYSRHGFAVTFDTDTAPDPLMVRVVAYVSCAGHKKRYQIDIPADGKGPSGGDVMSRTHAVGSAMTYGRGILLRSIFNLIVDKGSDDDGRRASGPAPEQAAPGFVTDAQVKRMQKLMDETNTPVTRVLSYASDLAKTLITTLQDIPARIEPEIMQALENAKARQKDAAKK